MSQDSRADATNAPQKTQNNSDAAVSTAEQNAPTPAATPSKATAPTDGQSTQANTANDTANTNNDNVDSDADNDTPMPPKEPIPTPARWSPKKKSLWGLGFFIALILIGIALILYAWQLPPFTSNVQKTDNAFIKGKTTIISPQVSGYVDSVMVQDFDTVNAGDVLVKIDDRTFTQQLEQAEANIDVATTNRSSNEQDTESSRAQIEARQADLYSAQVSVQSAAEDVKRYEGLDAIGAVSKAEVAHTKAQLAKARAAVQQAEANLQAAREAKDKTRGSRASLDANIKNAEAAAKQAQINLDNTVITAPESGQLSQVSVKAGQFVNAGTQLMYIVPKGVWVIANFKETQVSDMRIGMPATIRVDAIGGTEFTGHISNISPATGSEFSAGASNPATGNYIKITQRIPVRIDLDPNQPQLEQMRPGMSVAASVDTRAK
ncbi:MULTISPECIES: HlyD family secretion protein [unclassified Psychrobacter]|uniref:HlyD family secretion protein n=1 Tax=unclassified Psychrobacter TaxID=196806 RepID=UPI0018F3C8A8|nr:MULTISPECIES: HlyD family secretion protein [unclassified Psychrobacter]